MNKENCGNHDHYNGECLEIEWEGVASERERYEKQEALTQAEIERRQEYIKSVNKINRKRVAERNIAPF